MRGSEFAELTAFVAVAEQRSFAKAAAQLGIAPSTLSQTIRALEERLGVRLLNRTTRSVAPTEAGERLMAQLQPAFEGVSKAVEAVNDFRDKPMGTLRLLMSRPIANGAIASLLAPFLTAYPEITLDIVSDDFTTGYRERALRCRPAHRRAHRARHDRGAHHRRNPHVLRRLAVLLRKPRDTQAAGRFAGP